MGSMLRALLERLPFRADSLPGAEGDITHDVNRGNGRQPPESIGAMRQEDPSFLRAVIDNSTAVIYAKDLDGRYLLVNRRFEELFHIGRASVVGKTDYDLFPAERASAFRAFDQKVLAAGAALEVEDAVAHEDGLHTYISVKCPLRDESGRVYAICGMSTDITDRKRTEDAWRASEEKFRSLYDNTPAMMHSIDREGRIVSVSNLWLEVLGYERAEVIGRRAVEFLTLESRRFAEETELPEFFRTGQGKDIPYQFVKKSGEPLDVSLSAVAERDASGNVVRSLAVLTDVSGRVRAEETLRESEQRFRDFAETASDWLWETGPDHRFTFVSEPFRVLEADRTARLGIRRIDGADDLAEEPEKWRQHCETLERHEPFRDFVYRSMRRDGILGYVVTSGNPRIDARGRFLGYRGTARDITNAVRAEEALHESEQRFRDFAEVESDWFWETDTEHRMSWITGRVGTGGIVPGNRMGRRRWEYATDLEDEPEKWREHRAILDRREPFRDFIFKIRNLAGMDRYVSTSGKPVFAADGAFTGYRGVGRDVTDTVRAERDLRDGEERLELAIEAGNMGTWDYDIQRNSVQWSPRIAQLFALTDPQTLADFEGSMAYVHPEDRERVGKALAAALENRTRYREEFRINSVDDDRWVASHGIVVTDRAGRPVRMVGVVQDISARKRAETRQKLLLDELNHRVKNTLVTVQSVAMQMAREAGSPELFYRAFKARLIALSNAHDLLTRGAWQGASLRDLLQQTLAPYAQEGNERVVVAGSEVGLKPNMAVGLAMAFQELATNAAKHGALSTPDGRVAVEWRGGPPDADRIEIRWVERGGPPVKLPRRRGFGSRLLERGLAYEFRAEVKMEFTPGGLECLIKLPI